MAAVNKDFPSLLLLCILFFKRMEYHMLERCINASLLYHTLDLHYIEPALNWNQTLHPLVTKIASSMPGNYMNLTLKTYDQDLSLWRAYYLMETKMGTLETASAVHWHAHKFLKDTTALTPDL